MFDCYHHFSHSIIFSKPISKNPKWGDMGIFMPTVHSKLHHHHHGTMREPERNELSFYPPSSAFSLLIASKQVTNLYVCTYILGI